MWLMWGGQVQSKDGPSSVHLGGLPRGSIMSLLLLSPLLLVSFPSRVPHLERGTSLWPLDTGSMRRCSWMRARRPSQPFLVSPGQWPEHEMLCGGNKVVWTGPACNKLPGGLQGPNAQPWSWPEPRLGSVSPATDTPD